MCSSTAAVRQDWTDGNAQLASTIRSHPSHPPDSTSTSRTHALWASALLDKHSDWRARWQTPQTQGQRKPHLRPQSSQQDRSDAPAFVCCATCYHWEGLAGAIPRTARRYTGAARRYSPQWPASPWRSTKTGEPSLPCTSSARWHWMRSVGCQALRKPCRGVGLQRGARHRKVCAESAEPPHLCSPPTHLPLPCPPFSHHAHHIHSITAADGASKSSVKSSPISCG